MKRPDPHCLEALEARSRLAETLLSLAEHAGAPVCSGDGRWISDLAEDRALAARACKRCPIFEAMERPKAAERQAAQAFGRGVDNSGPRGPELKKELRADPRRTA